MERATGFTQLSLVQYVLMDTTPLLPAYSVTYNIQTQCMPSGETLTPARAQVDKRTRDLRFTELRDIYQELRGLLKVKRRQALDSTDRQLYLLGKAIGGPFYGSGCTATYERMRLEWNAKHAPRYRDAPIYDTFNGIMKRHHRILDTLAARIGKAKQ